MYVMCHDLHTSAVTPLGMMFSWVYVNNLLKCLVLFLKLYAMVDVPCHRKWIMTESCLFYSPWIITSRYYAASIYRKSICKNINVKQER